MQKIKLRRKFSCVKFWFILFAFLTVILFNTNPFSNNETEVVSAQQTHSETVSGIISLELDVRIMFARGGGDMKIIVSGDIAEELRNRPETLNIENYKEKIEDRIENTATAPYPGNISYTSSHYDGIIAGLEYTREGGSVGVDIAEITGLGIQSRGSNSDIVIYIDVRCAWPEEPTEKKMSDGERIFYALFGFEPDDYKELEEIKPNVIFNEDVKIISIGIGSIRVTNSNMGDFSKYRLPVTDIIHFTQNYNINEDEKIGIIEYENFNVIQSSLVLMIYGLIMSIIILSLPRSFFRRYGNVKKISWIHFMAIGFFFIILFSFFLGVNGLIIWIISPVFIVITGVLSQRLYAAAAKKNQAIVYGRRSTQSTPLEDGQPNWQEIGEQHFQQGDFENALNAFENGLRNNMQNEVLWNDKGFVLRKMGRFDEALKCFNIALKIKPDYHEAVQNRNLTAKELRSRR